MVEMCEDDEDDSLLAELESEVEDLQTTCETLRLQTLLTGEYDSNNCYIALNSGAGGTEAQDWNDMLYRMYRRYCERHGYTVSVVDYLAGGDAGVKNVSMHVEGENAYGFFKGGKGCTSFSQDFTV